jgi:hypothetical protein
VGTQRRLRTDLRRIRPGTRLLSTGALALAAVAAVAVVPAGATPGPYLSLFHTVSVVGSAEPSNGDQNPYGVADVTFSEGNLVRGDMLVSNFNASNNLQGTGTTIVQVAPDHRTTLFAQIDPAHLPGPCPGGVGLTTALSVLPDGYVVVGSLPVTKDGSGTPKAGCLIVLDSDGVPVSTYSGNDIDGPWDQQWIQEPGNLLYDFVSNVLNGTVAAGGNEVDHGTVVRLSVFDPVGKPPLFFASDLIGTGFAEELNASALVLGPTGVAYGPTNDTLYVADTVHDRIAAIPSATTRIMPAVHGGVTVSQGGALNAPLGLVMAPDGDFITVNGNDGNAVEITSSGTQVDVATIDPFDSGGDLFGLVIPMDGRGVLFVDDNGSANSLDFLH